MRSSICELQPDRRTAAVEFADVPKVPWCRIWACHMPAYWGKTKEDPHLQFDGTLLRARKGQATRKIRNRVPRDAAYSHGVMARRATPSPGSATRACSDRRCIAYALVCHQFTCRGFDRNRCRFQGCSSWQQRWQPRFVDAEPSLMQKGSYIDRAVRVQGCAPTCSTGFSAQTASVYWVIKRL